MKHTVSRSIERLSTTTTIRQHRLVSLGWLLGGMLWLWVMSSLVQADEQTETTHKILLSHHEFEPWTFTARPNDQIDIVNHSDISHSIYITYPDGTVVNLGVQTPGEIVSWSVPEAGDYMLACWIHPIIHSTLSVKRLMAAAEP